MGISGRIKRTVIGALTIIELTQRVGQLSYENVELKIKVRQLESDLEAAKNTQFKTVVIAPKHGFENAPN